MLHVFADSIATLRRPNVSGGDIVLAFAPMAAKALSAVGSKAHAKAELKRLGTPPVREVKRRRSISEAHPCMIPNIEALCEENDPEL